MNKLIFVALFVTIFAYAAFASSFTRSHAELQATANHLNALEKKLREELARADQLLAQRRTALNQADSARTSAHNAANAALNARNNAQNAFNTANAARTNAHNAANAALNTRNQVDRDYEAAVARRNQAHQAFNNAVAARTTADNNYNAAKTRLTNAVNAYNAALTQRNNADAAFTAAANNLKAAQTHRENVSKVVQQELYLIGECRRIIGLQHNQDNRIRCGDRVRLQGAHGGFFLTATQTGCPSPHNDGNQGCANFASNQAASVWVVTCSEADQKHHAVVRREQKIGLRSVFGRWLAAENSGCVGHGNKPGCLNANRPWFRAWEEFNVVTTGNAAEVVSGAQIGLRSHHGNYVVHESNHQAHANRPWFQGWEHLRITKA